MKLDTKLGAWNDSDYETLFTKDPAYFIEAILINVTLSDNAVSIEKQKEIFLKWIGFYANSVREEAKAEFSRGSALRMLEERNEGKREGMLYAFTHLPFKPSLIGPDKIDMVKVQQVIKKLKAQEPIGVTDAQATKEK